MDAVPPPVPTRPQRCSPSQPPTYLTRVFRQAIFSHRPLRRPTLFGTSRPGVWRLTIDLRTGTMPQLSVVVYLPSTRFTATLPWRLSCIGHPSTVTVASTEGKMPNEDNRAFRHTRHASFS